MIKWLFVLIILNGCNPIPRYMPPDPEMPENWKGQLSGKEQFVFENWWEVFNDPVLDRLEKQALGNNKDLWAAFERVVQAFAIAFERQSALFPQLTINPSFYRQGSLFQNFFVPGAEPVFRIVQAQYFLPLDASFELDLWQKLYNSYRAAYRRGEAQENDYANVYLLLSSQVAQAYYQIRGYDLEQDVLQKNIASRRNAFEVNQERYDAGLINYSDVSRAKADLMIAISESIETERLRKVQEDLLATLLAIPAPLFSVAKNSLDSPPPEIPAGIPCELLARRPDIREKERLIAAAYADVGVAYAEYFPSVTLQGTIGYQSPLKKELFEWQARYWEYGANAMQTLFDGGYLSANLTNYKAIFQEAYANYEEQVLTAFQQVEDALISIQQRALQDKALQEAVQASEDTYTISQTRYLQGLVTYLDVVDAERTLLSTERSEVQVLTQRYLSTILLIEALGGGW